MGTMTYKKGDRVRYTAGFSEFNTPRHIGKTGTVRTHLPHGDVRVEWDSEDDAPSQGVYAENIEIAPVAPATGKFKVGDRIVALDSSAYSVKKGTEYTVLECDEEHVRFTKPDGTSDGWGVEHLALAQPAAALTIEAGKFYKTRDGRKVGPMEEWCEWVEHTMGVEGAKDIWRPDGTSDYTADLIAEWVDEPAVVASNDNAPASPAAAEQPVAKFKVGDVVRRTNGNSPGALLRVVDVVGPNNITLEWLDGRVGSTHHWQEHEIELVTPAPASPRPAIVCLIENGQPKPADRPHVHSSATNAEREAARLASRHKGKEFGVYELVSTKREEVTYEHEWQRLAVIGRKDDAYTAFAKTSGLTLPKSRRVVLDWLEAA